MKQNKDREELNRKQFEWLFANRIAYIGNEIPDCFTTDKRSKSVYLGCPMDLMDEVWNYFQSYTQKKVEEVLNNLLIKSPIGAFENSFNNRVKSLLNKKDE